MRNFQISGRSTIHSQNGMVATSHPIAVSVGLDILKKAHDEKYIDMVLRSFPKEGLKFLDGDTVISPGSEKATREAVGSILKAIDSVEQKNYKNAFCVVRPPGG